MGAELDLITAPRAWKLRFGEGFRSSAARDRYGGAGVVEDWGDYCSIGPLVAEQAERFTEERRTEILACCADLGFAEAHVERRRRLWIYDLRSKRFERRAL